MKAHERRKAYRQFCARQLRAGLQPDPRSGHWGDYKDFPETTRHHLKHCAHPGAKRAGK